MLNEVKQLNEARARASHEIVSIRTLLMFISTPIVYV